MLNWLQVGSTFYNLDHFSWVYMEPEAVVLNFASGDQLQLKGYEADQFRSAFNKRYAQREHYRISLDRIHDAITQIRPDPLSETLGNLFGGIREA